MNPKTLDLLTLESWLWDAAGRIRGAIDAPKYKAYILPLLFYKRLSDVYADDATRLGVEVGRVQLREMRTKWASCSWQGTLTPPRDLVDDVLCHESR